MEIINIEGTVNIQTKELKFDIIGPVVSGENRTAEIKIAVPENLQAEDIYLEFKLPDRSRYVSPKLDVIEGYAVHKLINICLAKSGQLAVQLTVVKFAGEDTEVFKSKINTQITVSEGINAGEQIIESNPDIIAEVQNAINDTLEVKNQLLEDKENGVFKGEKGDEGIVDYGKTVTEYEDANIYGLNSYCYYNGKLYKSLQADNTGNNPQTATDYWEEAYYDKDFIDNAFDNTATAEQGTKADNAVPNTRKVNGKVLSEDVTLNPSDIGAATMEQGAKADNAEPSFVKNTAFNKNFGSVAGTVCEGNDPRLSDPRPADGGNADTVDGKHASEFATSEQGAKADSALQTETDPTVPAWAKAPNKPSYTAAEVGAATEEFVMQVAGNINTVLEETLNGNSIIDLNDILEGALYGN